MTSAADLPEDLAAAHAMILAERDARRRAEANAAAAKLVSDLEIERLKLEIARLRHARFGRSAERHARIEQLELQLAELEETAAAAEAVEPAPISMIVSGVFVLYFKYPFSWSQRLR